MHALGFCLLLTGKGAEVDRESVLNREIRVLLNIVGIVSTYEYKAPKP